MHVASWNVLLSGEAEQGARDTARVGDVVMGEAEVVDLVDVIEEKPAEAPPSVPKS